ncbi:MAG: hypothetical protein ACRYFX_04525 [Janthinobacterium lividum]
MDANQITLEEAIEKLAATEAQAEQLEKDLATERDARGKAEQQLRDANTLTQQLTAERNTSRSELVDANKLIDQLTEQVGEVVETVPTATLGTAKDAKTYRIVVPQFRLAGHEGIVKATEVKSNSAVLKALVDAGSPVLELVQAK